MNPRTTLYYVHDPMCSWCWGFRSTWNEVIARLDASIEVVYVLGGLAPDTDEPMPPGMRKRIQETWRRIQTEIPGTQFNYAFWEQCSPRRSTYRSCRAVIAAGNQAGDAGPRMLLAIQQAYYLDAKNPSDNDVLVGLAGSLGLNTELFASELNATETQDKLRKELRLRDRLGVNSFPSLVLRRGNTLTPISIDYNSA